LSCSRNSLIAGAYTAAVLGLEADGYSGQGFLVPFGRGQRARAQWITGYKGYNTIAARAGLTVDGAVVREGDEFDFAEGTKAFVHHKKLLNADPGRRIIAAFAHATAPGRNPIVKVLGIDEILQVRQRSAAARRDDTAAEGGEETFSPWNDDKGPGFPAMAEKTAKRRLARSLPLSAGPLEMQTYHQAARIDEISEEENRHAYAVKPGEVIIEGKAEHLVDPTSRNSGPSAAELEGFVMHGLGGDRRFRTIEQWRDAMIRAIETLNEELLGRFWDRNAILLDDYRDQHRDAVAAVGRAYEQRRRR
jgi:phage RecT family recombinase